MEILQIELDRIKPYERNPKTHGKHQVERIAESIKRYGMIQPLVVDKANTLVIGHGRYEAMKRLNMETAPCVRVENLTPKQIRELRIADNKLNEDSEWNDFLLDEIKDLDLSAFGMETIRKHDILNNTLEYDEIENVNRETDIRQGDCFRIGNHIVICEDSTNFKLNGIIDLLVTDPPYGIFLEKFKRRQNRILNDDITDLTELTEFLTKAFANFRSLMKIGASGYVFYAIAIATATATATATAGFTRKQELVWCKNHFVLGRNDYHWQTEGIAYISNGKREYFIDERNNSNLIESLKKRPFSEWSKEELVEYLESQERFSSAIRAKKPNRSVNYNCEKPQELLLQLICNSSRQGEIVFDGFAGSGSLLLACEQAKRKSVSVELNPQSVQLIIDRAEEALKAKAEKIGKEQVEEILADWNRGKIIA